MLIKNRQIRKYFLLTFILFLFFPHVMSYAEAQKDNSPLRDHISYPDKIYPGDPLFLHMTFSVLPKDFIYAKASVKNETGKIFAHALFYEFDEKNTGKKKFQVVLPLSTWLSAGSYLIQIDYFSRNGKTSADYPLEVSEKNFIKETIKLNSKNTAIKTDNSLQRVRQIEKLYAILDETEYANAKNPLPFILPVDSKRRTSFFGDRRVFAYSNGSSSTDLHYGIDFGVPTGTPVSSCANGRVVLAEERISTGFTVVIEHLPGLYSLYYHLDSFSVSEGEIVAAGKQIGVSGATGLATGPHLHWEIRLLGQAVNPDYFVNATIENTTLQ